MDDAVLEVQASEEVPMPEVDTGCTPECGICLGTAEEGIVTTQLACGHDFCKLCLHRHVGAELRKGRVAWCPTCRQKIEDKDVARHCPEALEEERNRMEHEGLEGAEPPPVTWWGQRREAFRMRRAAQRAHLKICPQCRTPIEKNEGCNHMTCRCGHEFDWTRAETVAPCHRLHRGRRMKAWGSTCPGCSPLAKVKLAALRTTIVVGAVPVAAVAICSLPVVGVVVGGMRAVKGVRRRRRRNNMLYSEQSMILDDSLILDLHGSEYNQSISYEREQDMLGRDVQYGDSSFSDDSTTYRSLRRTHSNPTTTSDPTTSHRTLRRTFSDPESISSRFAHFATNFAQDAQEIRVQ